MTITTITTGTAWDRLLGALADAGMKVVVRGDGARSQCPGHGSTGLTLSIRRGDDRALLHCFAACDVDEILEPLGLARRDLYDGDRPPGYRPPPRPEPTLWERLMAEVGVHRPPPLDAVLDRMVVEHLLEADPGLRERQRALGDTCSACVREEGRCLPPMGAVTCPACLTPTSPWSCSCGATRVGGAR